MPLTDRFVLTVDAFDRTGVFEFRAHDPTRELTHDHLVGGSGQLLSELYDQASDVDPTDILPDAEINRRAGYFLDAGGGRNQFTMTADVGRGDEDLQWGDGSSADGEATAYDAAGDVAPETKRDVLFRYLAEGRADSAGQLRLYTGEWSDGTYATEAGLYGEPKPVALLSVRAEKPRDESAFVTYTFEFEQVALVPDFVDAAVEDLSEAADDAVDAAGDLVPDW